MRPAAGPGAECHPLAVCAVCAPRKQNPKQTCGRHPGALDTGLPSNSLSSAEAEYPIILARDQGFVTGHDAEPLLAEVDELARMLCLLRVTAERSARWRKSVVLRLTTRGSTTTPGLAYNARWAGAKRHQRLQSKRSANSAAV